ncbi:2,3-bisphosphoglycerate-independent phosphoglycerate mutase [Ktedonosporobacter rubrisoli]|uniref:2,3-bisphosphoglycerate-independent phosphoglycerate mutase n=1 Tax=Ktedonosporobacter rubrisoli TaxID=2509675 RepID=A0A4V0YZH6_KTERU|nr:2,3-bisphosphoglycerate-independent phosphoglycerate mutase [Ktedonosporobacter rubrisoli]QBD79751.1 2,3-bisphosphoglycerate-independent phosphoglycerate mutase [Ktedonosporobacter rubrisoli]
MSVTDSGRPRPFVLIIMDGWGINPRQEGNAIALARTPNIDQLAHDWPHTAVRTSGLAVGLPEGQMGNSEVGHQNIGAGKRVLQDYTRVSEAIRDGSFFQNPAFLKAIEHVKKHQSQLHICGLLGNGGVHAHESHLEALLRLAQMHGVERVYIHSFTDGRDASPTGGLEFMRRLEARAREIGGEHAARVATVSGRYYAMDRDNRWDRTGLTYFAMTRAEGQRASSALEAIQQSYDKNVTDEFILPTVIMEDNHPVAVVKAGDAVIHCNFRPDRARQLTKAFVMQELPPQAEGKFERGPRLKDLAYVMMTEYESGLDAEVAYRADEVEMPLARVISEQGMRQFHTAETEKYAHVTYFINGRRETPFRGEDRVLVPSPKVPTYDLQPEMSAAGITDTAVEHIRSGDYDLVIMNYANADMVGHTGDIDATIKAVEAVDKGVGRVVDATLSVGGGLLITADHGNAEQLIEYDTGKPYTAHTTNPVPLYLVVPELAQAHLRTDGILADVAPTVLRVMGIAQPKDMQGRSLLLP